MADSGHALDFIEGNVGFLCTCTACRKRLLLLMRKKTVVQLIR